MEDYIQFSAKTKNDAITKACLELGVPSEQLEIQVVSEGSNGFFGIGSKPAIIKVRKKSEPVVKEDIAKEDVSVEAAAPVKENFPVEEEKPSAPKKPEEQELAAENSEEKKPAAFREAKEKLPRTEKPRQPKPAKEKNVKEKTFKEAKEKPVKEKPAKPIEVLTDPEEIREIEDRARVFLTDVFASMELGEVEITSKYNTTDGSLDVDFEGKDMGILIGKRGQTLDSLQYLTSLVVNKGKSSYIRVKLDTEDYRRRRKETLENLARGIAYKVKKTRRPVVLEPMNPYERRIIHSALQGNKFVETVSEGEEPYRHVVVKLKNR